MHLVLLINESFLYDFYHEWYNSAGKFQACGFLVSSHGHAVSDERELQENVYSNDTYIETASLLEQVPCRILDSFLAERCKYRY